MKFNTDSSLHPFLTVFMKKRSSIERKGLCVPLLVFIEDFGHGQGDFGNLLILGVGAHVAPRHSDPVLLRPGLVVRHRLTILHSRVLLLFIWKVRQKLQLGFVFSKDSSSIYIESSRLNQGFEVVQLKFGLNDMKFYECKRLFKVLLSNS